tara:strand:- start:2 stop:187 length:186 start_codon:yes stop_codon:yes gene_type:complete
MTDKPEESVNRLVTRKEFVHWQMPSFNFELSADELVKKALSVGLIKQIADDLYEVNEDYWD